ncbi:bifunctional phosphoribosyl-AMP cyclohydrolase/phosphoribosyl-ATP diphosphatase HisIE [Aerococcaceae bacterium 50-4]
MTGIDFEKNNGLVPAILQDYQTKQVLMLGYMNKEAYELTVKEDIAWFYSRSKERLWKKGESSGNIQKVVKIDLDCDQDTVLVQVQPMGPTCHTGSLSCFGDEYFNLNILEKTVVEKIAQPKEGSYTTYLMEKGLDKILKKCGEEMTEVVIAAKNAEAGQGNDELINESSDLLYHFLVLLAERGLSLSDIEAALKARHGQAHTYSERKEIKDY